MRKVLFASFVFVLPFFMASLAFATNGDNLIGIGPISRSMGGVGIAAPQDAISAVFSNPAAMCFGPFCPGSEFNFAGTLFMPDPSAKITVGGNAISADSDSKVYAIPAIGISVPITNTMPLWRFGLAAYGVSGLGVDYRNSNIDQPNFYDFSAAFGQPPGTITAPLASGTDTQLQIMKFSPNISFQPNDNISFGLGVHIDYSSLDLGSGSSFNYGVGAQLGVLYKPVTGLSIGATYTTPQSVNHENVADFDQDGNFDDLKLESPQVVGLGIAVEPIQGTLLFEVDGKWINWENAEGYDDFDWQDQYVLGIGAQFKPIKKLSLRAGYNYGRNPVKDHDNFNGGIPSRDIQGKTIPFNYYYETFRIIGFPAIVQNHITVGIGYEFSNTFAVNLGYMHAFEETISENGTAPDGVTPVTLESKLSEDSVEFGLTWRF